MSMNLQKESSGRHCFNLRNLFRLDVWNLSNVAANHQISENQCLKALIMSSTFSAEYVTITGLRWRQMMAIRFQFQDSWWNLKLYIFFIRKIALLLMMSTQLVWIISRCDNIYYSNTIAQSNDEAAITSGIEALFFDLASMYSTLLATLMFFAFKKFKIERLRFM